MRVRFVFAMAMLASFFRLSAATPPLSFELNKGQVDASVRYLSRGVGKSLYLTSKDAIIVLEGAKGQSAVRMSLAGASANPQIAGVDELPGKVNYLTGSDPASWKQDVRTYRGVVYKDVYPGIDLRFHGDPTQLEYDLVVAPGANPGGIRLRFAGASSVKLDDGHGLLLRTRGGGILRQHAANVFQDGANGRRTVRSRYRVARVGHDFEVTIDLGAYDKTQTLVIDPVLSFSTYFGGLGAFAGNQAWGTAVDADGNVYIAGDTTTSGLPVSSGAFQSTYKGSTDAFVAKLDPTGSTVLYCTYIGGTQDESAKAIAVDIAGDAYVSGETRSTDFPVKNAVQTTLGGGYDAFLLKLNPSGSALIYSTYLGGGADDHAYGVSTDDSGAAYATGSTKSTNFPVKNALQPALAPNSSSVQVTDAFVTKLDANGALSYSTYYGGSGTDSGAAIAVDGPTGAAYVTGTTDTSFPVTVPTFITPVSNSKTCSTTAFVFKLNPSGTLAYSLCFGGRSADTPYAIAIDVNGQAYVAGGTTSGATGFPLVNSLQSPGGGEDAFLAVFNAAGSSVVYSTLLGGESADRARGVTGDGYGNIVVAGWTSSTKFPVNSPLQAAIGSGGGHNLFVTKIKSDGTSRLWSTYFGGSGGSIDEANAVASDLSGNVYITGKVGSTNFPTTIGAVQTGPPSGGSVQSFITRIGETPAIGAAVNGSTFAAGIAPGTITSLFGSYLSAYLGQTPAIPLAKKYFGATVKVNGIAAPLYYVAPNQINFQMPLEIQSSSADITVTVGNLTSAPLTVPVAASAPGIFTVDSSGKGQGVVLIYPNNETAGVAGTVVGLTLRPIKKGEFAIIYAAGLGAVSNAPASGAASPADPARTVQAVSVNIGGVAVPADFSGLVPGLVGLYQVNVQIPANAPTGSAVNLSLMVGGTPSNTVTIAIQ